MSNAMRMGKRTLAGVAAGALGAGLLVVAGAPSAGAAVITPTKENMVVTPAMVGPVRNAAAAAPVNAGVVLTNTNLIDTLQVSNALVKTQFVSGPADATNLARASAVMAATTIAPGASATATIAFNTTSPLASTGTYTYTVYYDINNNGLTAEDPQGTLSVIVSAAPTQISLSPVASQTVAVTGTVGYTITQLDASNLPAVYIAAEVDADSKLNLATTAAGTASVPVAAVAMKVAGQSASTATLLATGVAAGTATITPAAFKGAGVGALPAALPTAVGSSSITVITVTGNALEVVPSAAGSYINPVTYEISVPPSATTDQVVTVDVTSSTVNGNLLVANTGGTFTPAFPSFVSTGAAGKGQFTVTVPKGTAAGTNAVIKVGGGAAEEGVNQVTINVSNPNVAVAPTGGTVTTPRSGSNNVATYGSVFTITGVAKTQYGTPLGNFPIQASVASTTSGNNGVLVTAVTSATGAFTVSYTDATAVANRTGTKVDTVTLNTLGTLPANFTNSGNLGVITVSWQSSGVVLSGTTFGGVASTAITGYAWVAFDGVADSAATLGGAAVQPGDVVRVSTTASVPGVPVTFAANGAKWGTSASTYYSLGSDDSVTVTSNATTGVATAYLYATKSGTYDVSVSATTATPVTAKVKFQSAAAAARNLQILDADNKPVTNFEVIPGQAVNTKVKVTDVFGNALPPYVAGETGVYVITANLTQFGSTIASNIQVTQSTIGADGTFTITVSPPSNFTGVAYLSFTGTAGANNQFGAAANRLNAASVTNDAPGFTASNNIASATVTAKGTGPQSITITGERATVSGKPGIMIDGATVGFDAGAKMKPFIRFPGQTEYTEGSARPTVTITDPADKEGEFTWQRKTGKKTYVYFVDEANTVQSNRVIIAAN